MSDNRPIVYHDATIDRWVYRASSVGRSIRCLVSARQGATPLAAPQYLLDAAERGNRYEPIVKARLRADGWRISGEQNEVEIPIGDRAIIRGHLDGLHCLAPGDDTDRILEVKSMSPRVWDEFMTHSFERFPEYAAQLTCYMEANRRPDSTLPEATYAVVNAETDEIVTLTVPTPPLDFETIRQKVLIAEFYGDRSDMPTCTGSKYRCPYEYLCDRNEMFFEELESGSDHMLERLAEEHAEVDSMLKELEAKKAHIRSEITTAIGERKKVAVPGWLFNWVEPGPRKSLNAARLREELGEELEKFYDEKPSTPYLTVRATRST